MTNDREIVRTEMLEYLSARRCAVLAVNRDGLSHAATMMYFNEGFSIILATLNDTIKISFIRANPNVALAIDDQAVAAFNFGLQVVGVAEILERGEEFDRLKAIYLEKMPEAEEYFKRPEICLIRARPSRVYFKNPRKGQDHRDVLNFP